MMMLDNNVDTQELPVGTSIKVEVRNSNNIFVPGSNRQITDDEIRAARRNVRTGTFKPSQRQATRQSNASAI